MIKATIKSRAWLASLFFLSMFGTSAAMGSELIAEIWKDPNCGCCEDWVRHLEDAGIHVRTFNTGNAEMRRQLGIATQLGSCHTAKIGGYAVEGHVPAVDIKRLLDENREVVGLAVPGMPIGSPGMDDPVYGERKDPYAVLLIHADGRAEVYRDYR